MRLEDHTCDSSSPCSDDALQFYTIRPGSQESLPRFHARLNDLADKCNFLCSKCQAVLRNE